MDKALKQNILPLYLKGGLILIITGFISVCVFASIMLIIPAAFKYTAVFATLSLAVGCFLTAFYITLRQKKKGLITGLAVGGSVFIIITLLSLLINSGGVGINTFFRLIILILSGLIGGIIGVNKATRHKYI